MQEYSYGIREAFARSIAESLGAFSCKDIPNEFGRTGWVWITDDGRYIIKMSPKGISALNNEIRFCSSGWNTGKWETPEIIGLRYYNNNADLLPALIYKPVLGKMLSWGDLLALTKREQEGFAADFGEMAAAFHAVHNIADMENLSLPTAICDTVTEFLEKLPKNTELDEAGKRMTQKLAEALLNAEKRRFPPKGIARRYEHTEHGV